LHSAPGMIAHRRLCALFLVLAGSPLGCGDEDAPVPDDIHDGDSADPDIGVQFDGYTVPSSLGLDKDGVVYLTFDDGPSPALTPRILDTLAAHQVPATFFVTGTNIAGNEEIMRRQRDEGHIVANHQWRHVVASRGEFHGWVRHQKDLMSFIVGEMPLYFRYPYGAMAAWKEEILRAEGYRHGGIGWDIDTLDWDYGPDGRSSRAEVPVQFRNDMVAFTVWQAERKGGGVILMHDVQSITANELDRLIRTLRARGFRFGQLPGVERLEPAPIECPSGYELTSVGNAGGQYCTDERNVIGPFTRGMVNKCVSWGGGDACRSNRWSKALYLSARGVDVCPKGARLDPETRYCAEGEDAFGPFPRALVASCIERGGGEVTCRDARWNRNFLAWLLRLQGA